MLNLDSEIFWLKQFSNAEKSTERKVGKSNP